MAKDISDVNAKSVYSLSTVNWADNLTISCCKADCSHSEGCGPEDLSYCGDITAVLVLIGLLGQQHLIMTH